MQIRKKVFLEAPHDDNTITLQREYQITLRSLECITPKIAHHSNLIQIGNQQL